MTMYSIWGRMGEDHDYYCLKSNVEQADVDKIIKHYLKTWREVEFREFAILHSQEGEKEIDMSTLTKAVQTHKEYEEAVKDEDGYPEETDYDSKEANKFIQGLIAQMCLG